MEQKTIRIADAIPAVPASFDLAMENALQKAVSGERTARQDTHITLATVGRRRMRMPKRTLIALVAAAILMLATTAFSASAAYLHALYRPTEYLAQPAEQRTQAENAIPELEQVIESAKPQSAAYTVTVLPDMPDADKLNAGRQSMGQPAYAEADWGWLREIRLEVEDVLFADGTLSYTIRLHTPHGLCFVQETGGQRLDAYSEDVYWTHDGAQSLLGYGDSGAIPESADETGVTIHTALDEDTLSALPASGTVTLTDTIGIYDCKVDDMAHIGLLANITYTFSFDADAAAQGVYAQVNQRALSGKVTLSIARKDNEYANMPVSLDGVILEEVTEFRTTGVYVTYRLKAAPDDWTEEMRKALLSPSHETGKFAGFSAMFVPNRSDPNAQPIRPEHADSRQGELTFILPIFASDYDRVRSTGYGLDLTLRCIDTFEEQPVGESWTGRPTDPEEGWNLTTREQPLLAVTLPNP